MGLEPIRLIKIGAQGQTRTDKQRILSSLAFPISLLGQLRDYLNLIKSEGFNPKTFLGTKKSCS